MLALRVVSKDRVIRNAGLYRSQEFDATVLADRFRRAVARSWMRLTGVAPLTRFSWDDVCGDDLAGESGCRLRRMRVLHVYESFLPTRGGIENHIR